MPWKLDSHAGFKVTAFVVDIFGRLLAARHHISDRDCFGLHHFRTPRSNTDPERDHSQKQVRSQTLVLCALANQSIRADVPWETNARTPLLDRVMAG
jgi:hypothetical protein